jgi:hypothetical protein
LGETSTILPIISSTEKELEESVTQVNTATTSEEEKKTTSHSGEETVTSGGEDKSTTPLSIEITSSFGKEAVEAVTQLNTAVTSEQEKELTESGTSGLPEIQTTKESRERYAFNTQSLYLNLILAQLLQ